MKEKWKDPAYREANLGPVKQASSTRVESVSAARTETKEQKHERLSEAAKKRWQKKREQTS